jgi:hypothetical protein
MTTVSAMGSGRSGQNKGNMYFRVTLSISGAPVAKALMPTVGTVRPSARLGVVNVCTGIPACTQKGEKYSNVVFALGKNAHFL